MENIKSNKRDWVTTLVTAVFLIVPLGSSFMSLHHVQEFIALGNPNWMAWFMSIVYELASIAILVAIVRLDKLNPYPVWIAFLIVTLIQIIGNAYFIYDYVKDMVAVEDNWIKNFVEFSSHMFPLIEDQTKYVFILSCVLGISIPALSVLLTKSATDYLKSKRIEEEVHGLDIEEEDTKEKLQELQKIIDDIPTIKPIREEIDEQEEVGAKTFAEHIQPIKPMPGPPSDTSKLEIIEDERQHTEVVKKKVEPLEKMIRIGKDEDGKVTTIEDSVEEEKKEINKPDDNQHGIKIDLED